MKIKIVRPCGTVVEGEGAAEECAALAQLLAPSSPQPWWFVPVTQYTAPNSGEFRIEPLVVTSGTVSVGLAWLGTVTS